MPTKAEIIAEKYDAWVQKATPLTIEAAKLLPRGTWLYALPGAVLRRLKDSGGRPIGVRTNGSPKTWKTRPNEIKIPVKFGIYDHFYIRETDLRYWTLTPPDF